MICDDCAFYDCAFCGGNVCAEYIGSVSTLALTNQMGFLTGTSQSITTASQTRLT